MIHSLGLILSIATLEGHQGLGAAKLAVVTRRVHLLVESHTYLSGVACVSSGGWAEAHGDKAMARDTRNGSIRSECVAQMTLTLRELAISISITSFGYPPHNSKKRSSGALRSPIAPIQRFLGPFPS